MDNAARNRRIKRQARKFIRRSKKRHDKKYRVALAKILAEGKYGGNMAKLIASMSVSGYIPGKRIVIRKGPNGQYLIHQGNHRVAAILNFD